MSEKDKKQNTRKKIPIIIMIVLLVLIFLCFLYSFIELFLDPSNVFVIEKGKIYEEENALGYIIRDEKVLYGENYKNGLVEIKTEGTKVSKGENVFRYYSNNEDNLKEQIAKLDIEISEALEGQTEAYSADIQLLDKQIDGYIEKITSTNNIIDIEEYKSDISDILIKKAKITGELSPSGSHINGLIERRRKLEEELNGGQEYVKATMSGTISYKVDGLEETLSKENFTNLNKELLESYNLKTGQMVSSSTEARKNSKQLRMLYSNIFRLRRSS